MRTPVTAVTSNIIQRTLYIRSSCRRGAAFAIEVDGRQVLLTAKHIFDGSPADSMLLLHEGEWKRLACKVYFARYGVDLAVVDLGQDIAPRHPINLGMRDVYLGEDAYLLGFPLDFYTEDRMLNRGLPIPMVAKGCIAGFQFNPDMKEGKGIYITTNIYHGYSGGPVVCRSTDDAPHVVGIISENVTMKSEQVVEAGEKVIIKHPASIVFANDLAIATEIVRTHQAVS